MLHVHVPAVVVRQRHQALMPQQALVRRVCLAVVDDHHVGGLQQGQGFERLLAPSRAADKANAVAVVAAGPDAVRCVPSGSIDAACQDGRHAGHRRGGVGDDAQCALLPRRGFAQPSRCSQPLQAHLGQGRQPAARAQVDQLYTGVAQGRRQRCIVAVNLRQLARQRVAACRAEEMVVGEIDTDQANPPGAKMARKVHSNVGRIVAVIKAGAFSGRAAAAALAQSKAHRARMSQRVGREDCPGLRRFDIGITHRVELTLFVDDHQVVGRETAPDVVDADSHKALGMHQQVQ